MSEKNLWIDEKIRDRGSYRKVAVRHKNDHYDPYPDNQYCNVNEMEDALIEALDAGMSIEEIVDAQLGSIS